MVTTGVSEHSPDVRTQIVPRDRGNGKGFDCFSRSAQDEHQQRMQLKLTRELGEQILALLEDPRTEDILLNPDSSLWIKRMGEGFTRVGEMPANPCFECVEHNCCLARHHSQSSKSHSRNRVAH